MLRWPGELSILVAVEVSWTFAPDIGVRFERLFVEAWRCTWSWPAFLNTLDELEEPTPLFRSSRSWRARSIWAARFCAYSAASLLPLWERRPVEFILLVYVTMQLGYCGLV